jgi:hypothetical protein
MDVLDGSKAKQVADRYACAQVQLLSWCHAKVGS